MKTFEKIVSVIFILALSVIGAVIFIKPSNTFSENENRFLQHTLDISVENIFNGKTQQSINDFMKDQFPLRDKAVESAAVIQRACGKDEINGAYIASDNTLYERASESDIDEKNYLANLHTVSDFLHSNSAISSKVMLVPSSAAVLKSKLPSDCSVYDAEKMLGEAQEVFGSKVFINTYPQLNKEKNSYIFYRTDHHWTTRGAYSAYKVFSGSTKPYESLGAKTVSSSFLGTLHSKVLLPQVAADSVDIIPVNNRINISADGKKINLYDKSALSKKDKYRIFFGGNYGVTTVSGCSGKGTLLIIKDSFANSFVPFLLDDYSKIIMIDPRYFAGGIEGIIKSEQVSSILVLYEINNFAADNDIVKLALG